MQDLISNDFAKIAAQHAETATYYKKDGLTNIETQVIFIESIDTDFELSSGYETYYGKTAVIMTSKNNISDPEPGDYFLLADKKFVIHKIISSLYFWQFQVYWDYYVGRG